MLSNWLSSWYQQNEQQQQQQQQQESFKNIEQRVGEGEDDWVQVITPSIRQQKQSVPAPPPPLSESSEDTTVAAVIAPATTIADSTMTSNTAVIDTPTDNGNNDNTKGMSRQERRAKARFAVREMKKQARNAAMVSSRTKKGLASSTCLPASPL